MEKQESTRPYALVLSTTEEATLDKSCDDLCGYLTQDGVDVRLQDVAHTLSLRMMKRPYRGYAVVPDLEIESDEFMFGKTTKEHLKIGFVFTGQGAQWPKMGKDLIEHFPPARDLFAQLDEALQQLPNRPTWSIIDEISQDRAPEHLQQPEFSQPLVTALQLVMCEVYRQWGVEPSMVVGHSSGEFAAAYAQGLLSMTDAIKAAYCCGWAAKQCQQNEPTSVGMLAVAVSAEAIAPYLAGAGDEVVIACFNGPKALSLSGTLSTLTKVKEKLKEDGHYASFVHVDLAYHSHFMNQITEVFESEFTKNIAAVPNARSPVLMYSTVTAEIMTGPADAAYWKKNLLSPVCFRQAVSAMLNAPEPPDALIEIGPAGILAGPVVDIKASIGKPAEGLQYHKSASRGQGTVSPMLNIACKLFVAGHDVNFERVNQSSSGSDSVPLANLPEGD